METDSKHLESATQTRDARLRIAAGCKRATAKGVVWHPSTLWLASSVFKSLFRGLGIDYGFYLKSDVFRRLFQWSRMVSRRTSYD
ncbi:hypothetical protein WG66_002337 [Moniliophthora roreri]|nr:hypothetical protein WG66_002337 [Moniliophthora roreri]